MIKKQEIISLIINKHFIYLLIAITLISILITACTIHYIKVGQYHTTQDINNTNHIIKDIQPDNKGFLDTLEGTTKTMLEGMGLFYGLNKVMKLPQVSRKNETANTKATLSTVKNKEGAEKIKEAMKNMMTPEEFKQWCIKEGMTYINGDCI